MLREDLQNALKEAMKEKEGILEANKAKDFIKQQSH